MVFRLYNVCKSVDIPFQLEGFLNEGLGIAARGEGVSLDELLAAIEILHYGIRRHLHGKGADRQGQRQQQRQEKLFHTCFTLPFQKNTAQTSADTAARMTAIGIICFIVVPPL